MIELGSQLDALVAEKVFGLNIEWHHGNPLWVGGDEMPGTPLDLGHGKFAHTILTYSTDIAAAWDVVERMKGLNWSGPHWKSKETYMTEHGHPLGTEAWYVRVDVGGKYEFCFGETAAYVICLAALKAVGHRWEER